MKELLRKNRAYLYVYAVILVVAGLILLLYSKENIHLFTNQYHSSITDWFFRYITYIGDGMFVVYVFVLFLFIRFRFALIVGISGILGGLIAQFFKRVVFSDVVRPLPHFHGIAELYLVPGVHMHTTLSLPSGHTTTAFTLFFVLASFSTRHSIKLLCLMAAILVGYSRIYLSQHFLIDVYFGSVIGTISGIIIVYLLSLSKKKWLEKSLIKIFVK